MRRCAGSPRHVLVIEAAMSQERKVQIFGLAERVHKAGNELAGSMRRRLEQLQRTKKYRKLKEEYAKSSSGKQREDLSAQMRGYAAGV